MSSDTIYSFCDNKYTKWYFNIVNRAQARSVSSLTYIERHHILPRCMGGGNEASNIAPLTAREHFLCHMLLIRMTEGQAMHKMAAALSRMCKQSGTHKRELVKSWQFEMMRKAARAASLGPNNYMFGRTHTEETKQRIRDKAIARNANSKRTLSPEAREKISISKQGKKRSAAYVAKLRERMKGSRGPDNTGRHWYTNGATNRLLYECPEGYWPGRS